MSGLVEIKNLQKKYDKELVLKGLTLSIPSGSIFGLIGPNGAGKSTLIGILTGLLSYEEGEVYVNDLLLNEVNELKIKKQLASVLQPPLLFEQFTSYDFLDYICDMYDIKQIKRKDKIHSLFEFLGLTEFEHVKISKLSSGSRKKLSFCAAILSNPEVLLLDEPFESIDVISIGRMKTILKHLKEQGKTVIITSHILEIVENLCDDIAILHEGTILAYLDSESRAELQKNSSLNEIFESYIEIEKPKSDVLKWL